MSVKTDGTLAANDFFKWHTEGITMLKPNGQKVGVTELEVDWSREDWNETGFSQETDDVPATLSPSEVNNEPEVDETENLVDNIEETTVSGVKNDPQVSVNGIWLHKSTILKQTFTGRKASTDRLRRVQGLSKTLEEKQKEKLMNLDDVIFPGDPVLCIRNKTPILGSIVTITKGLKKVNLIQGNELQNDNVFLVVK